MLKKTARLIRTQDFQRVFRSHLSFRTPLILAKVKENTLDHPRFGIIVANKISKKAVVRNRIKRRIRDIIEKKYADFSKKIDIIFYVQPLIKEASYLQIQESLYVLFTQIKSSENNHYGKHYKKNSSR